MPSNEALELLESVLSESKNFRKYTKTMNDKFIDIAMKAADDIGDTNHPYIDTFKYIYLDPQGRKVSKDLKNIQKDIKKRTGIKFDKNYSVNDDNTIDKNSAGYPSAAKNYKKSIEKDVEKANARQRGKVVGGYKLEAACILIEALDTLLGE